MLFKITAIMVLVKKTVINSSDSRSNRGRSDSITKYNTNLGSREVINHQIN